MSWFKEREPRRGLVRMPGVRPPAIVSHSAESPSDGATVEGAADGLQRLAELIKDRQAARQAPSEFHPCPTCHRPYRPDESRTP